MAAYNPLATPYEYQGVSLTKGPFKESEVVGRYQIIKHGTDTSSHVNQSLTVTLERNGQLSGDAAGNWQLSESLELEIAGVSYLSCSKDQ